MHVVKIHRCRYGKQSKAAVQSDHHLGSGPRAAGVRSLSVAGELDLLCGGQLHNLLDLPANAEENLLTLLGGATLSTSHVTVAPVGDSLADGAGPDADTIESLADVDYHAHDLAVVLILESVANGRQHYVQPQLVNVDVALLLELVGPLATVLILGILPLWSYASLEEMIVGLEGEIGDGRNVVLRVLSVAGQRQDRSRYIHRCPRTLRLS